MEYKDMKYPTRQDMRNEINRLNITLQWMETQSEVDAKRIHLFEEEIDAHLMKAQMTHSENHIINCNYCGKEQVVIHPNPPTKVKHVVRCPICTEVMTATRWECEDGSGWVFGWLCGCTERNRGPLAE